MLRYMLKWGYSYIYSLTFQKAIGYRNSPLTFLKTEKKMPHITWSQLTSHIFSLGAAENLRFLLIFYYGHIQAEIDTKTQFNNGSRKSQWLCVRLATIPAWMTMHAHMICMATVIITPLMPLKWYRYLLRSYTVHGSNRSCMRATEVHSAGW